MKINKSSTVSASPAYTPTGDQLGYMNGRPKLNIKKYTCSYIKGHINQNIPQLFSTRPTSLIRGFSSARAASTA